ncbi:acyltransferase family protein [Glutamicibacter sp. V16R2B1]|uniref:acyltransferase family protein n=1 Tax=Glutamicibacter sp. V16R2B1 TaxID=2036207 RepID=UPI0014851709|nr:acyltransferase family protein [Glutamicibacter sp. V16R2B1]
MSQQLSTSLPAPPIKPRSSFRGDIQGVRALAVGVVVLYHFWPHRLTGGFVGVDVFFVISGFLITAHLISKPPRTAKDVGKFWMRRVRRLLPASFLVILSSILAVWAVAPATVWRDWGLQGLASTFYFQNWYLAGTSVDYMAEGEAESPFQHFWSLSVEEQFYFIWPIMIGLLVFGALHAGIKPRAAVLGGVGTLLVCSLGYSVYLTEQNADVAYFSTFTRMWEFAVGALVAALGPRFYAESRTGFSAVMAWVGLLAVAGAVLTFEGKTPFPGVAAAIPVVGTALVIAAHSKHRFSPDRLLGLPIMRFTGDNSYAIYLWHWPILILAPFVLDDFFATEKITALVITVLLAVLTQRLVETRFRRLMERVPQLSAPRFLVTGSLVLALIVGGFQLTSHQMMQGAKDVDTGIERVKSEVGIDCFGASAMKDPDCADPSEGYEVLAPSPLVAEEDRPPVYEDDCFASSSSIFSDRTVCHYGEEDGQIKVALVGNSHAGHWVPALDPIAEHNDWSIDTYLASACAVLGEEQEFDSKEQAAGCDEYGDWAIEEITNGDYDLIISSNRMSAPIMGHSLEESEDPATEAYGQVLQQWESSGSRVVVLRDTPWPGETLDNVPDCVSNNDDAVQECSAPADTWLPMDPQADAVQQLANPRISVVNMNDYFCSKDTCHSVIGGVMAYFDHSHLSETFAQTLTDPLENRLRETVVDNRMWK